MEHWVALSFDLNLDSLTCCCKGTQNNTICVVLFVVVDLGFAATS